MRKVVHLRMYLGREILKRENGDISNPNQKVSLIYETLEWNNYLKNIKNEGICKLEVEKLFEHDGKDYKSIEIDKKIIDEVNLAFKNDIKVVLTPEQKEIAELKAQMKKLLDKNHKVNNNIDNDLAELQAKYKEQEKKEVPSRFKNDKEWIKNKLKK